MAIQKIPVHGEAIASTILDLLVPAYFDSYAESDTPGTYNLYKGSNAIATVDSYGNVVLKYNNGASTIQTIMNQYVCDYLYVCSNGLAYSEQYNSEGTAIRSFLTKDNNGDVVIVRLDITPASPSSSQRVYAANYRSTARSESMPYTINMSASQVTSLAPIALTDDYASYCPNAYVAMYRQNNGVAQILDIAGIKYITNGMVYLKDE